MLSFFKKKKRIFKRNDGTDYINDLLKLISLKNVRMSEISNCEEPAFFIRHDVDHDMDMALEIGEIEAQHNFVSTFFLLPPGSYDEEKNYYGYLENGGINRDPSLTGKCRRLIDLGHDIGFHNDMVAMALKMRHDPRELILREVDFFKKNKINFIGTASHGSPLARMLRFNNRELFKGCIRKGWETGRTIVFNDWQVQLHSLHLSDFEFQFEAYSLPRDSRLSDSGGKWGGRIVKKQLDKEKMFTQFDREKFRAIISNLQPNAEVNAMQVMTHPCHWRVES